ncbi:hypothetical protein UFOVP621_98 [uncultured Caudovirales phage]|uniref:Uncharacterized protein n=1 Tax=uncultured Caudovirales phage TaxID=2100421 RepID=A0A6J5N3N1_9CAUD|nr:hypothetical protein UFOVP621_98 [uncultured Caudovirales phage]
MSETSNSIKEIIDHTNTLVESICDLIMAEARKDAVPQHMYVGISRLQEIIDHIKSNKIEV